MYNPQIMTERHIGRDLKTPEEESHTQWAKLKPDNEAVYIDHGVASWCPEDMPHFEINLDKLKSILKILGVGKPFFLMRFNISTFEKDAVNYTINDLNTATITKVKARKKSHSEHLVQPHRIVIGIDFDALRFEASHLVKDDYSDEKMMDMYAQLVSRELMKELESVVKKSYEHRKHPDSTNLYLIFLCMVFAFLSHYSTHHEPLTNDPFQFLFAGLLSYTFSRIGTSVDYAWNVKAEKNYSFGEAFQQEYSTFPFIEILLKRIQIIDAETEFNKNKKDEPLFRPVK